MTTDPARDRLSLLGMRFEARHGVHDWEKETPQPFEVDLVLHADLSDAAATDRVDATVDYGPLFELVRGVVEGRPHDLIEALAGEIASASLAATPSTVVAVEVRVRKPKAPIDGAFDTVEVALIQRRE